MYDARQIANWFIERARRDNRKLTIMQLLKLVYISHGWHLEMRRSPLIVNKIEAWKFGPVIPDVYNAFRKQGVEVSDIVPHFAPVLAPSDENLLEQIYNSYGRLSAERLSDMTHVAGGPWEIATTQLGYFAPIRDDLITAHYQQLRQAHKERA